MPTNEERREVARKLRKVADILGENMDGHEFAHYVADSILGNYHTTWKNICRKYDCRKHESKELFNDFDDNWANNVEIVDMAEEFLKDDKTYQEQSGIINKALKIGML